MKIHKNPKQQPNHYLRANSARAKPLSTSVPRGNQTQNNLSNFVDLKQPLIETPIYNPRILIGMSNQQIGRYKRSSVKSTTRSVQQLYQQNTWLKRQNNRLVEQVSMLRGKFQAKSKKGLQRDKELDMEFGKMLYWGGGNSKTHLISGIKYQYSKLKSKFQQQAKQLQKYKILLLETKAPQWKIQVEVLERENRQLTQKLIRLEESLGLSVCGNENVGHSRTNRKVVQVLLYELQTKNTKLQTKIVNLQQQIANLDNEIDQKQKKILFLQKLLIQKDNTQYHFHRKTKKLERDLAQQKQSYSNLAIKLHQIQKIHQNNRRQLIKQHNEDIEQLKQQSKKQMEQYKIKIEYLHEDNRELENTINKLRMGSSVISNSGGKPADKKLLRRDSISVNKFQNSFQVPHRPISPTVCLQIPDNESLGYQSQSQSNFEKTQRKMKTANQKNSKQSKKIRKVHFSQVSQISQLIKYRMIAAGLNLQSMSKLFEKNRENPPNDPSNLQWDDTYINMAETKAILKASPFKLQQQDSQLFSRYLIQDCNQQYVYRDELNQNKRQIIKSIIKHLIGPYNLSDEQTDAQIKDFKAKYQQNLYSALKTYYPQGKVNKRKFVQVLNSMGTDLSQKSVDVIIAKLVDQSVNLTELCFQVLHNL